MIWIENVSKKAYVLKGGIFGRWLDHKSSFPSLLCFQIAMRWAAHFCHGFYPVVFTIPHVWKQWSHCPWTKTSDTLSQRTLFLLYIFFQAFCHSEEQLADTDDAFSIFIFLRNEVLTIKILYLYLKCFAFIFWDIKQI